MNFNAAEIFIQDKLKKELPPFLFYHSYAHTIDVLKAAIVLADKEGIQGKDVLLLKTAVLFHDSGFTLQSTNHEEIGCNIVHENLPHFDYSNSEIEQICGMIMATKIPQSPKNILEEIICDADLDYLGRDDFESIANSLFKELEIYHILSDVKDWNHLQLKFLESHHYFTKSALGMRQEKKEKHTQKIRDIVNSY
ncbi:MAG: HD domain-containing protein [Bacteroidota bacterium]|nr:HD domain-containing protein [Bacteroidota bacterium]